MIYHSINSGTIKIANHAWFQMSGKLAIVDQATTVLDKVKDYLDTGMETTMEVTKDVIQLDKGISSFSSM